MKGNWSPLLSEMTERRCGRCRTSKPLDQFYVKHRAKKYPDRLSSIESTCKACISEINKGRKEKGTVLKSLYGLTIEDWNLMFMKQSGCCLLCKRHETEIPKRKLNVDHDHATGKVRGLLCSDCNMALGLFRDNRETLARAIEYLQPKAGGEAGAEKPNTAVEIMEKVG